MLRQYLKTWMVTLCIILLCGIQYAYTQANTINLESSVEANFGIDADVRANLLNPPINNSLSGTDDWFYGGQGSGLGVIHLTDAAKIAILNAGTNVSTTLRMSASPFSEVGNNIWYDALYNRDMRTNGNLVDDSFFTSGSDSNADDPTTWTVGVGSGGPQKNDIIDSYLHLRSDGLDNKNIWAFFGVSTRSQNGTSYVDVEFFRNKLELVQGKIVSEGLDDGRTAYVFDEVLNPGAIKQNGDFIFSMNYTNGGEAADVRVFIWMDLSDKNNAWFENFNNLSARPFLFGNGTGSYPRYNNGEGTKTFGYAQIQLGPDDIRAQVNENEVDGPDWGTIASGGQITDNYGPIAFAEFAINGTLLNFDLNNSNNLCEGILGSVVIKTRSSDSFTSELKDLVGPFNFGDTPALTVEINGDDPSCNGGTTTLTAVPFPDGIYTYEWYLTSDLNTDIGNGTAILTDVEAGSYNVKATIQGGCFAEDEITINNPQTSLEVACPDPVTTDCTNDLSTMFNVWKNTAGFTYNEGVGTISESFKYYIDGIEVSESNFALSNSCGGNAKIEYTVTDDCGEQSCDSTFKVNPDGTIPVLAAAPLAIGVQCIENVPAPTSLSWTDNCDAGGSVLGVDGPLIGGECGGTITRTWNVMDACLNAAVTRTQIITVNDTTKPVLGAAPLAISVQCVEDVPAPTSLSWTDNCDAGGSVLGIDGPLIDGECGGTITRTWNVMDACLNAAITRTQIITVNDTTKPVLAAAPLAISVQCIEDVPAPTSLIWTDNCDVGGSVLSVDGPLIGGECGGTITRTWNVMDACLNAAITRTQIITVNDTTKPVLAAAPLAISVQCLEDVPAPTSLIWTDNCDVGGSVLSVDGPLIGGECGGTITRTWNVMDACLNAAITRTQIITVNDTTKPVLTAAPLAISVQCIEDVPAPTSLSWTDNCDAGGSVLGVDGPLIGGKCGGTITRTWNVMDACLNAAITRSQIITVNDTIKPVLSAAPLAISVQCIEDVTAPSSLSWTDNCDAGGSVLGVDGPLIGGECGGTITRTWNVMDACLNAAITRTQIITVNDTINPEITDVADYTFMGCLQTWPDYLTTTWTDNCSGSGEIVSDNGVNDGSSEDGLIIYRIYTFEKTDACGNRDIETTRVSWIIDLTPPEIQCPPMVDVQCIEDVPQPDVNTVSIINSGSGGELVIQFVSDVSDNGSCPEIITRTYSATDGCGNIAYCTQLITVNDTINPEIIDIADYPLIGCNAEWPPFLETSWTDNCATGGTIQSDNGVIIESSSEETIEYREYTFTVTDNCGNSDTKTTIVSKEINSTPPEIQCPPMVDVQCIEDVPQPDVNTVSIINSGSGGELDIQFVSDVSDNGSCPEIITRTYSATDGCGNIAYCTQIITVHDTINPEIIDIADYPLVGCNAEWPPFLETSWTDNCSGEGAIESDNGIDLESSSDGTVEYREYTFTVSDNCGNSDTEKTIVRRDVGGGFVTFRDSKCITENAEFDLFDYLIGDYNTNGIWERAVGNNMSLNGSFFNPSSLLDQDGNFDDDQLTDYVFIYTISGVCPSEIEVIITINNICIDLACEFSVEDVTTALTPNNDAVNETFYSGLEPFEEECTVDVQIFNRWGAKIFEAKNYQNDWRGTVPSNAIGSAGKITTGTYYYIINYKHFGKIEETATGYFYAATE